MVCSKQSMARCSAMLVHRHLWSPGVVWVAMVADSTIITSRSLLADNTDIQISIHQSINQYINQSKISYQTEVKINKSTDHNWIYQQWRDSLVVSALDQRPLGRGFESSWCRPACLRVCATKLGQSLAYLPSPISYLFNRMTPIFHLKTDD